VTSEEEFAELRETYPEVERFAKRMLEELGANRSKGDQAGWRRMDLRQAWQEIAWHLAKLAVAVRDEDFALIHELAADVGNGALMLDDIALIYEEAIRGANRR
jgi:hypothetical protein